jgi:osmotically-inducible protein OsmY
MSMIGKAGLTTVAGAAGAAAAYMLDPERGRTRRAQARDQLFSRYNSTKSRLQKQASYTGGMAAGAVKRAAPGGNNPDLNVNAEGGAVFLRGEVETQEQIDSLVQSAGRVDGVEEVRNLMHLPGQPAPGSG